jgi:hypothetical protein
VWALGIKKESSQKKVKISGENIKSHQLEIFRHLSCIIGFSTGKNHGDYIGISNCRVELTISQ